MCTVYYVPYAKQLPSYLTNHYILYCLGLQLELNEVQLNCGIERGQLNILSCM